MLGFQNTLHGMYRMFIFFTPLLTFIFLSMDFIDDPAEPNLTAVFEIPGIKTSDISLHILDGHLVVSGERRPTYLTTQQSEPPPQNTTETGVPAPKLTIPIQELRFGTFRRAVRVPEGLKVRLPFQSSFSILHPHLFIII